MVGERVIKVFAKISFKVAFAPPVFPPNERQGFGPADAAEFAGVLDSLFEGTDEADVKDVAEVTGDDVSAASDQDRVTVGGEGLDGFDGLLDELPDGRMNAEEFIKGIGEVGDTVFGHEPSKTSREVVVLKDFFNEVAVEDGPSRSIGWGKGL